MKFPKSASLISLLLLVGFAPVAGFSADVTDKPTEFQIPAESLADALSKFGAQTGMQIVYPPELARGVKSRALSGRLKVEAALAQMLAGTGLTWSYVNTSTIVLKRAAKASSNTLAPGPVRVAEAENRAAQDKSGEEVQEMLVEGEREKRKPYSDANMDIPRTINDVQPYYIFDAKTIERSGATNIEDFLKSRLTMNTVALTNGQTSGKSASDSLGFKPPLGNTSTINLRGVGADKTLILIDGRRRPNVRVDNTDYQPDLNGIPLGAIDRIEVLPASASGIYGGSAVGGVINIVLKRDYSGGEIQATYDNTWSASAPSRAVTLSYGTSLNGGKTHLNASVSFTDSEPLLLRDRLTGIKRNIATIQRNSPAYLINGDTPWLGAVPNIANALPYLAVPEGTPDAFGPFPVEPPYTTELGITEEYNYLLYDPNAPLRLKNGTLLSSRNTYVPAGTSNSTSPEDLRAALIANAGAWNLELPMTTQSPTGLLLPFGAPAKMRAYSIGLRRELRPGLDLSLSFSDSHNDAETIFNPSGAMRVPGVAPSNPFTTDITLVFPDADQIPVSTGSQSRSITVGAVARLPGQWTSAVDYTWSESQASYLYYGVDGAGRYADMVSGELNPFVDTLLHPLSLRKYLYSFDYGSSNRLHDLSVRASGSLPILPWGAPSLTIGLEHRIAYTPETSTRVEYPVSTLDSVAGKSYERESVTSSGYLETTIPLIKSAWLPLLYALDLQVSGRSERFQVDTGTQGESTYFNRSPPETYYNGTLLNDRPYYSQTTYTSDNHTVGLKYQPLKDVIVRTSRATAFLPPTPQQLLKNPLRSSFPSASVNDPVTGQRNVPVYTIGGGNPDLKPQNSESFNLGVIWEPSSQRLRGLRVNIEYYRTEQFDAIGSLSAQQIVNQENLYPGRIVRDSLGRITEVDQSLLNLFHRDTEGLDISLDYAFATRIGQFGIHASETTIKALKTQYAQTSPAYDAVGYHPYDGGAGKYKANGSLSWDWQGWSAAWSTRYFGSYKTYGAAGGPYATQNGYVGTYYINTQGSDTIPSQAYHDLFLGYTVESSGSGSHLSAILSGMTFQFGLRNVFDKTPPMDVMFNSNYYFSPYGDTRMRSYWLSVRKAL